MSEYRVYILDPSDHVRAAVDIEAASDEEACQQASRAGRDQPVELWRLDRFLCRFDLVERPDLGRTRH